MTFDLDDDEDFENLAESLGLPERLPPLWLPPLAELAATARDSALLRRVGELVAWMGEQREVTEFGELAEAAEAAEHLAVTPAELLRYWEVALATDLAVVSDEDGEAATNPDLWPTDDDEEDLGTWVAAFRQTLMSLEIDVEIAGEEELNLEDLGSLMLPLFLARSIGVPVEELREIARDMATEHLDDPVLWDDWVTANGDPVTALLARLTEHGAVEVDEETARLTPLGLVATREDLVEAGIEIPVLPPVSELPAADLLLAVGGLTMAELPDVTEKWVASRGEKAAVAELVAAVADTGPGGRIYAVTLLADLPDVPWSTLLDVPSVRPYALAALEQERGPAETAWVLLDFLSATENALGELDPGAVEQVLEPVASDGLYEDVLAAAWRLPHPATFEVLTLIGTHHPDKKLAKAARTAAHKAQSAGSL
jgi:hypothetical protein